MEKESLLLENRIKVRIRKTKRAFTLKVSGLNDRENDETINKNM